MILAFKKHPMTKFSYEIGRFVYLPGRNIYSCHIRISPKAISKLDAILDVLKVFIQRKLPIVHLKISRPTENKPIDIIVFIDLTEKKRKREMNDTLKEIKALPLVDYVELKEPTFKGLAVCDKFYLLTIMGERAIILRRTLYEIFAKSLRDELGSGYVVWLYQLGIELGRNSYRYNRKLVGDDIDKLIAMGSVMFGQAGFGKLEVVKVDFSSGRAIIRVYDSFECELYKGSGKASSYFIRGIIKGYAQEVFRKEVVVTETKCIAKGDSYCEFVVS